MMPSMPLPRAYTHILYLTLSLPTSREREMVATCAPMSCSEREESAMLKMSAETRLCTPSISGSGRQRKHEA